MYEERVAKSPSGRPRRAARRADELTRPTAADLDEFRRGIDPIRRRESSERCSRNPSELQRLAAGARVSRLAAARIADIRWRWSCGTAAGDPHRRTLTAINGFQSAWVRIDEPSPVLDSPELPAELKGFYYIGCRPQLDNWWRHDPVGRSIRLFLFRRRVEGILETAGAGARW